MKQYNIINIINDIKKYKNITLCSMWRCGDIYKKPKEYIYYDRILFNNTNNETYIDIYKNKIEYFHKNKILLTDYTITKENILKTIQYIISIKDMDLL